MSFDEFIYRLKSRFSGYFNSENKFIRLAARLTSLAVFAAVISTIAPTIADELSSSSDIVETSQPAPAQEPTEAAPSETPGPSDTPSPEAEVQIDRPEIENSSPSPLAEPSDSATVTEVIAEPLENQPRYTLRIPQSVAVDPRAKSYYLAHIYAGADSAQYTLACISGAGLSFDIRSKLTAQNSDEGKDLISGDQSGFLLISGNTARVVNLINSQAGLMISSTAGSLPNKVATMRFIALTAPSIDPSFCSAARSSSNTVIRPLSLEQSTVKGGGRLK